MGLPASGVLGDTNAGHTKAEFATEIEQLRDFVSSLLGGAAYVELTIASGSVTPAVRDHGGVFRIDTEGSAGTDDLANIVTTNISDGQLVMVTAESASRIVTLKNAATGSGEMLMRDSADFVLDSLAKWVLFQRRGSSFTELARSYGTDYLSARNDLRIPRLPKNDILDQHERLRINYATASTCTVAADALSLTDANGNQKRYASVSKTLTISTTGANGRDVTENGGLEKSSDWYHIWAIGKEDGTIDVFGTLDCFPGGISIYGRLPSGYTYAGYYGAIYNDVSSNFRDMKQRGAHAVAPATTALNAGSAISYTVVSLVAHIPDTAQRVEGTLRCADTNSVSAIMHIAATSSGLGEKGVRNVRDTTAQAYFAFELQLVETQNIYYYMNDVDEDGFILTSGWAY